MKKLLLILFSTICLHTVFANEISIHYDDCRENPIESYYKTGNYSGTFDGDTLIIAGIHVHCDNSAPVSNVDIENDNINVLLTQGPCTTLTPMCSRRFEIKINDCTENFYKVWFKTSENDSVSISIIRPEETATGSMFYENVNLAIHQAVVYQTELLEGQSLEILQHTACYNKSYINIIDNKASFVFEQGDCMPETPTYLIKSTYDSNTSKYTNFDTITINYFFSSEQEPASVIINKLVGKWNLKKTVLGVIGYTTLNTNNDYIIFEKIEGSEDSIRKLTYFNDSLHYDQNFAILNIDNSYTMFNSAISSFKYNINIKYSNYLEINKIGGNILECHYIRESDLTIPIPKFKDTNFSLGNPYVISVEQTNGTKTIEIKDSTEDGTIYWFKDSLMSVNVGMGNTLTVPIESINMFYAFRINGNKISNYSSVTFRAWLCNVTTEIKETHIDIPFYKEYIIKKAEPNYNWTMMGTGMYLENGYHKYKMDKVDTTYTFYGIQKEVAGQVCPNSGWTYIYTVIDEVPNATFTDTIFNMEISDSILISFEESIDMEWKISSRDGDETVLNNWNKDYTTLENNSYTIKSFKAFNNGHDTITWHKTDLDNNIIDTKTVVFNVTCNTVNHIIKDTIYLENNVESYNLYNSDLFANWCDSEQNIISTEQLYTIQLSQKNTVYHAYTINNIACPKRMVDYTIKVADFNLPHLNTVDTTINLILGDKLDVAFKTYAAPEGWYTNVYSGKDVVVQTDSTYFWPWGSEMCLGCNSYYTLEFTANKEGVDTLKWYQLKLVNELTLEKELTLVKQIIVKVTDTNDIFYPFIDTIELKIGESKKVYLPAQTSDLGEWTAYTVNELLYFNFVASSAIVSNDNKYNYYHEYIIYGNTTGISTLYFDNTNLNITQASLTVNVISDCPTGYITFEKEFIECEHGESPSFNPEININYTSNPLSLIPIDTIINRSKTFSEDGYSPYEVIVSFNNNCKLSVADSIHRTIINIPKPITKDYVYELGETQEMVAHVDKYEIWWNFYDNRKTMHVYDTLIGDVTAPGVYIYSALGYDTATYCGSAPVDVKLTILNSDAKSIKGNVIFNGNTETAYVQLYKKIANEYTPIANKKVQNDNSYEFKYLEPGNYIVQAIPTQKPSTYCSTYYPKNTEWNKAYVIELKGKAINVDIELQSIKQSTIGNGTINGIVNNNDFDSITIPSYQLDLLLQTPIIIEKDGEIIYASTIDSLGVFSKENLGDGLYTISIDIPGYARTSRNVRIVNGSSEDVEFIIKNGEISLSSEDIIFNNNFKVYPNPCIDIVTIDVDEDISKIQILSLTGNTITENTNSNQISVKQIPSGIYILKAYTNKGIISKTIIKQ